METDTEHKSIGLKLKIEQAKTSRRQVVSFWRNRSAICQPSVPLVNNFSKENCLSMQIRNDDSKIPDRAVVRML